MTRVPFKLRKYRERSQPKARAHLGFLQKHADYKKRAEYTHKKKELLTSLKEQALNRNPDEYHPTMKNRRMRDGKQYKSRMETDLTPEELALIQTQDTGYLQYAKSIDVKKVQRLEANLHRIGAKPENTRILFASSPEEQEALQKRVIAESRSTLPVKLRPEQLSAASVVVGSIGKVTTKGLAKLEKQKRDTYAELHQRKQRIKKFNKMLRTVDIQHSLRKVKDKRTEIQKIVDPETEKVTIKFTSIRRK
ncbi:U3 small nucleolar RNA-associated protein 11 [Pelomyxa schiedti]|nr:U3 small nucleolar RNA-associated protein 11 [Pelomyxa schiedti]